MHECPDCYDGCYCGGDIDDMFMSGTPEERGCTHCADDVDDGDCDERCEEDPETTREIDYQLSGRWEK